MGRKKISEEIVDAKLKSLKIKRLASYNSLVDVLPFQCNVCGFIWTA